MNININETNGMTVIALSGRFTFGEHSAFREAMMNHIDSIATGGKVILNLSGVEFVDSAALGMLLLARETAQRRHGSVILRGATGQVQRMLEVSRFGMLFAIEA